MAAVTDRRELLADAAIAVIAGHGMRALTHRAVDAAAGVPSGTTSYHFRSRRDLLRGILNRIADINVGRLAAAAGRSAERAPIDRAERLMEARALAERCGAFVDGQLTAYKAATLARLACELEVASDPELREILHAGDRFRVIATGSVARLGSGDPGGQANGLIALLEGLQFDRLVGTGALHSAPAGTAAARREVTDAVLTYLIGIIPTDT